MDGYWPKLLDLAQCAIRGKQKPCFHWANCFLSLQEYIMHAYGTNMCRIALNATVQAHSVALFLQLLVAVMS